MDWEKLYTENWQTEVNKSNGNYKSRSISLAIKNESITDWTCKNSPKSPTTWEDTVDNPHGVNTTVLILL